MKTVTIIALLVLAVIMLLFTGEIVSRTTTEIHGIMSCWMIAPFLFGLTRCTKYVRIQYPNYSANRKTFLEKIMYSFSQIIEMIENEKAKKANRNLPVIRGDKGVPIIKQEKIIVEKILLPKRKWSLYDIFFKTYKCKCIIATSMYYT